MKKNVYENNILQKTKRAFIFSAVFFTSALYAQNVASPKIQKDVKVVSDRASGNVSIAFKSEREIYNLLILITDSIGKTIFLDNRYRFNGDYNNNVDFKPYKKGEYTVRIIGDNEHITRKIDIR